MNIKIVSQYKKNIIRIKFFISILSISAIAVIILAISMYYWFQDKSMVEINNANRLALSNIDTVMSGYLDTARRISMELYQSADIKSLILKDGEEWNDNVQKAGDRILSTMSVNTYITSVYVFSKSRILLKPTNRVIPEKYENTFMDMAKKNEAAQPLPWVLETASGNRTGVISILFKERAINENDFTGAVMVNMNMDMLHGKVFANHFNNQQQLYIIDKSGRVLLQNDMEYFGENVSSEQFFKEMIKAGKDHGSLKLDISGKDYYLSYITSINKDYYTISLMEYGLSIIDMTRTRNIVVVVCLSILLCVFIVSIFISYKIYKPINNIFTNIRSMFSNTVQNQAGMNEIQLASQTIARIIERMNSYEKEKERNTIKNFFLKTGNTDGDELEESLRILNLSDQTAFNYCIIVFRVSSYKSFIENNSNQAVDFQLNSMETIASGLFCGKALCCRCCICDDHVALIIREDTEYLSLINMDLMKLLSGIQEAIQKMLGLEVTVGVSEICSDIRSIKEKYKEACELTNYRLIYGKGSIIDSSLIKSDNKQEIPDAYLDYVLEAVMKNSRQAFEDSIDKLILICRQLKLSYGVITETFSKLASSMLKIPEETGISNKNKENINSIDIFKRVESLEDYSELKSWLLEIYEKLVTAMSEINNVGLRDIISKALEYIAKNYGNPDITANYIAERLAISPSYFSRIFKECVGTSFPEYIINIRLEKAREILIHGDKPDEIKDICYKVGYSNTSYFTAAFRKKFGITPSKYRLHYLSSDQRMSNH